MDFFDELEQLEGTVDFKSTFFALQVSNQLGVLLDTKGWSMADLAAKMGVSRQYVHQILSGKQNVTLRKLAEVCHALGVDPADLLNKNAQHDFSAIRAVVSIAQTPIKERISSHPSQYSQVASLRFDRESVTSVSDITWHDFALSGNF